MFGGSPAKSLTSFTTNRVRCDENTKTQDASFKTPTGNTTVTVSTGHGGSPHASIAEDEPALMVDYNESTPLSVDDDDSERMWHSNESIDPITDVQLAPVQNSSDVTVTSQSTINEIVHVETATISSTISKESAILDGSAASSSFNISSEL